MYNSFMRSTFDNMNLPILGAYARVMLICYYALIAALIQCY